MSLGHAAYSGMGAYATGLLIVESGWNPWVSLLAGGVIVGILAVPIGIASLRVRGASFVIVSIALVLILRLVAQSWSELTGGSSGMRVPRPFPSDVLRPEQHERFFYLNAILLAILLFTWWWIDRSRFGVALHAIRDDEDKAESLGIPTFRYKLVMFVLSAATTALGGGLYALWFGSLDPIFQFSILVGASTVLMALLGGVRSLIGPTLGAIVIGAGLEYFKTDYGDTQLHLVALGVLLVVVVLFVPDGIAPAIAGWIRRFGPEATSIREVTQGELADEQRGRQREETPT
jgi:branched-chain amino acid transport system permease protein